MKRVFLSFIMSLVLPFIVFSFVWAKEEQTEKAKIVEAYGKLPLYFIENKGQIDERVKYYEKGANHSIYFTSEGIYITLFKREKNQNDEEHIKVDFVVLKPIGANGNSEIVPEQSLSGKVNY
ncbi:MAG: hypothetical protein N3F66_15205, partial [Spirochaetes bacterium]|nr:hypothetical protein [Spirochaetota bacterium]